MYTYWSETLHDGSSLLQGSCQSLISCMSKQKWQKDRIDIYHKSSIDKFERCNKGDAQLNKSLSKMLAVVQGHWSCQTRVITLCFRYHVTWRKATFSSSRMILVWVGRLHDSRISIINDRAFVVSNKIYVLGSWICCSWTSVSLFTCHVNHCAPLTIKTESQ